MKNNSAFAPIILLYVLAAAGVTLFVAKPRALHGDSKRADQSTQATANLETATNKQGAEAAASVTKIIEVNATTPDSRQKDFIAREGSVALTYLPQPDPLALLAAEKRRVAVMEGQVVAMQSLYGEAMQRADTLQKEKTKALIQRQAIDDELQRVAAERLGEERQRNQMMVVAALAFGLFVYVKFTHLSPGAITDMVHDIRVNKVDPVVALDGVTSRTQQKIVSWLAHFKSKP